MFWYVYKENGLVIARCTYKPSMVDLETRNQNFIKNEKLFDITKIKAVDGKIVPKTGITNTEREEAEEAAEMKDVYHEMFRQAYVSVKNKDKSRKFKHMHKHVDNISAT